MPVSTIVHEVFGHFQNLNLLGLLHDLRAGQTARHAWLSGTLLCPIAHGLPQGEHVNAVGRLSQAEDGCVYAARHLGADFGAVQRFVQAWDEERISRHWLTQQLEAMWEERLADAEYMQQLLNEPEADD